MSFFFIFFEFIDALFIFNFLFTKLKLHFSIIIVIFLGTMVFYFFDLEKGIKEARQFE